MVIILVTVILINYALHNSLIINMRLVMLL